MLKLREEKGEILLRGTVYLEGLNGYKYLNDALYEGALCPKII